MYYKKLNEDGSVELIGTQEEIPTGCEEITKDEYVNLLEKIKKSAVHVIPEE